MNVESNRPEDPESIPPEYLERLGLRFYIDNNIIGDRSPAVVELQTLHRDGRINLWRTDTVSTELADTTDQDKRRELLDEAAHHVESHGPAFYDHSTYDHAVYADASDDRRHERVYRILFPESDRSDNLTGRGRRKYRDAMHLATAIRYGCNGFITRDDHDLVRKSAEIASQFDGFQIMHPDDALACVRRERERHDIRTRQRADEVR
jgi:predicted nucleic acid-binding protein